MAPRDEAQALAARLSEQQELLQSLRVSLENQRRSSRTTHGFAHLVLLLAAIGAAVSTVLAEGAEEWSLACLLREASAQRSLGSFIVFFVCSAGVFAAFQGNRSNQRAHRENLDRIGDSLGALERAWNRSRGGRGPPPPDSPVKSVHSSNSSDFEDQIMRVSSLNSASTGMSSPDFPTGDLKRLHSVVSDASGRSPAAAVRGLGGALAKGYDGETRETPSSFPSEEARIGMRLNEFAGLSHLDFYRDAYSHLTPAEKAAYVVYSPKVDAACQSLLKPHNGNPTPQSHPYGVLDPTRFYQLPDDFTKLRYLQADRFDVDKALTRLTETLVWRQTSGLDDSITNPDELLYDRYRNIRIRRLVGYTKTGRILMCERVGEFLGSDVVQKGLSQKDWILSYSIDICEVYASFREFKIRHEDHDMKCHRLDLIGDLSGLNLGNVLRNLPLLKAMATSVEPRFVEVNGTIMLINTPSFAMYAWGLVKRFLDARTAAKVRFVSGPGKELIRELYGAEAVPIEFGGTNPYVLPHVPKVLDAAFEAAHPRRRA